MTALPRNGLSDQLAALHQQIDTVRRNVPTGSFVEYVPTFTTVGAGADPVLGVAGFAAAQACRIGDLGFVVGRIYFGSSGGSAGVGDYQIGLPWEHRTTFSPNSSGDGHGRMSCYQGSNSLHVTAITGYGSTLRGAYPLTWPSGTDTTVGAAAPWAWSDGVIEFSFLYPVGPFVVAGYSFEGDVAP